MNIKNALLNTIVVLSMFVGIANGKEVFEPVENGLDKVKKITTITQIFSQKVVTGMDKNWKLGYDNYNGLVFMQEYVPKNQTVENWKSMFTVMGMKGLAHREELSPESYLNMVATNIQKSCPLDLVYEDMGSAKVSGFPAHSALIGCRNVGGKYSEIAYHIAVKGIDDIYSIQRAERSSVGAYPLNKRNAEKLLKQFLPIALIE